MAIQQFFYLIRPLNLGVLILTQAMVYYTLPAEGCGAFNFDSRFGLLLLATLFLASAGYVINDYFDAKIDLVNKPEKMVLDTRLRRRYAIGLHIALNTIAVLIGFYLSIRLGIFNMGVALALLVYSMALKKRFLIGNLFVAALMGLVVFVVWLFDRGLSLNLVLFYSLFAFMTGLLREIIKDIEDRKGDAKFSCRTLPIVLGVAKTKRLLLALSVIFLAALIGFIVYPYQCLDPELALYLLVLV